MTLPNSSRAWVQIGTLDSLHKSARHHLTLRDQQTRQHHSLLLFSFPSRSSDEEYERRFYCMEAACPHLGAPLENATLEDQTEEEEEIEDIVIVCPWHEYDFSLKTGESSHGISTCVYAVEQRPSSQGPSVWIEAPPSTSSWDVLEVRPVSESFSHKNQLRESQIAATVSRVADISLTKTDDAASGSVVPPSPTPKSLVEWACLVLNTPEPRTKVAYTRMAASAFRNGEIKQVGGGYPQKTEQDEEYNWHRSERETPPHVPPRLDTAIIVEPGKMGKRGKGGTEKSRIALLHSLANIEQWAIDLAWDIISRGQELAYKELRHSDKFKKLPVQFYSDWLKVAEDEAKHFSLLVERIESMGSSFGSLPVHHGLWDSALDTVHSLPARLSIIHLVHEARGLDVNPTTIMKFKNAKDAESVDILTIIHLDEVTHVAAGNTWLSYVCAQHEPPKDPIAVFREEVKKNFVGKLKGPFNSSDREKAGLSKEWYESLEGEKQAERPIGVQRAEVAGG